LPRRQSIQLLHGTLELLVLETLSDGAPRHGFGILNWIAERTDGSLTVEEGALYPALHRLERKGFLESEWGVSKNNRKAKYYQLTPEGRAQLSRETSAWREYVDAVAKVMTERSEPDRA